jgi:hypothetical protein
MNTGNVLGQILNGIHDKAAEHARRAHETRMRSDKAIPKSFWITIGIAFFFAVFVGSGFLYEAGKENVSALAHFIFTFFGVASYAVPTIAVIVMLFFIAPMRIKNKELAILEAAAAERMYWNNYNIFYAQPNRHEILTVLKSKKTPFKTIIDEHKADWFATIGLRNGYKSISELSYEDRDYCYDVDKLLASYYEAKPTDEFGNQIVRFFTPTGHADSDFNGLIEVFTAQMGLISTESLDDDPTNGYVDFLFVKVNPLEAHLARGTAPVLFLTEEQRNDPYYWLPVAINQRGQYMDIPLFLPDGSVRGMHAGQSGTGKSGVFWQLILFALKNKFIDVWVSDGKGGAELSWAKPYAQKFASNAEGQFAILEALEAEVKRRAEIYAINMAKGVERHADSWNHIDDGNFLLWAWDEIAALISAMTILDPKRAKDFWPRLAGVLTVARSLGIGFIFSSQTFRNEVIPISITKTSFSYGLGYQLSDAFESGYLGFTSDMAATPDKLNGHMISTGDMRGTYSSVGQFATRGIHKGFGKSFYMKQSDLVNELNRAEKAGEVTRTDDNNLNPSPLELSK